MFWLRDWVWHAYLMSLGTRSRDHTRLIGMYFLLGRIVGRINAIWGKTAPNCIVLGHLLVPELIIKGWDGLNLANSKEMFIGIVNLTNFDQLLNSSYWQFVVHCRCAAEQMNLVSPGFKWQIWKFRSTMEVTGKHLLHYRSLVRKKYQIGWR